jgi:hypothetical protein
MASCIHRMSGTATAYDIHPDGKRFIMISEPNERDSASSPQQLQVVLDWFEALRARSPGGR